jgi:hypothetical protein
VEFRFFFIVIPAKAGISIRARSEEIPAFAGMTDWGDEKWER